MSVLYLKSNFCQEKNANYLSGWDGKLAKPMIFIQQYFGDRFFDTAAMS
jgi:hypothetical protein